MLTVALESLVIAFMRLLDNHGKMVSRSQKNVLKLRLPDAIL